MKTRLQLLMLLLAMPALAIAQRGGGRGGGGGGSDPPRNLSTKDLEQFDPAKFLFDNRKDLKLDAGQVATFDTVQRRVRAELGQLAARFDTLQQRYNAVRDTIAFAPGGGGGRGARGSAPEYDPQRDRMLAARQKEVAALLDVQRFNDSVSAGILQILTDSQRVKAAPLLAKRNADLVKLLTTAGYPPPATGGGRRGRGGVRP